MSGSRLTALLLIAVQALALGLLYDKWAFAAGAVAVALLGLPGSRQVTWNRERRLIAALGLALPFAGLWRVMRAVQGPPDGFLDVTLTAAAAEYFVSLQVAALFLRDGLSPLFPLFAGLGMVFCGTLMAEPGQDRIYQWLALAFVPLLALHCAQAGEDVRRDRQRWWAPKVWWTGVLLVLVVALGSLAGNTLRKHAEVLNQLDMILAEKFAPSPSPSGTGFSRTMRLGSVRRLHNSRTENRAALRILSAAHPGYLRGMAYDHCLGSRWETVAQPAPVMPLPVPPPGLPETTVPGNVFALQRGAAVRWRVAEVWPDPAIEEGVYLPANTALWRAPVSRAELDENGILDSADLLTGVAYAAYVTDSAPREPLSSARRRQCLQLPDGLDPEVRALARRLCPPTMTTAEKIRAVVHHFVSNYEYNLDLDIPEGRDPLTYFLLARPAAYCEYFAAGAAVLLRLAGVPTRYAVGFVPTSRNAYGNYWVARHKDAHAWCEAYDEERGWVLVEATPAAGVPEVVKPSLLRGFADYFRFRRQELWVLVGAQGVRGLLRWLLLRIVGLCRLLAANSVLGWGFKVLALAVIVDRVRRLLARAAVGRAQDPAVAELHSLLLRLDRRLQRQGFQREPAETLHHFAARLEQEPSMGAAAGQLAGWYREYALARYAPEKGADRIRALRARLDEVLVTTRQRQTRA